MYIFFISLSSRINLHGLLSMIALYSGFCRSHMPPHVSKMEQVADVILITLVVICIRNVSLHALSTFKFRKIALLESEWNETWRLWKRKSCGYTLWWRVQVTFHEKMTCAL